MSELAIDSFDANHRHDTSGSKINQINECQPSPIPFIQPIGSRDITILRSHNYRLDGQRHTVLLVLLLFSHANHSVIGDRNRLPGRYGGRSNVRVIRDIQQGPHLESEEVWPSISIHNVE